MPTEVGRRTCVDPTTICCYEQLFFHISDRLEERDFIVPNAIDGYTAAFNGVGWLLKSIGYSKGPQALAEAAWYVVGIPLDDCTLVSDPGAQLDVLMDLQRLWPAECDDALQWQLCRLTSEKSTLESIAVRRVPGPLW